MRANLNIKSINFSGKETIIHKIIEYATIESNFIVLRSRKWVYHKKLSERAINHHCMASYNTIKIFIDRPVYNAITKQ